MYDEYQQVPEVQEESNMKKLIRKMGLGAFSISVIVHLVFLALAIFYFVQWVEPTPEKVDFLPGGGGGGGKGGEVSHKLQQQKRMMTSPAATRRIASTSTNAAFTLPDTSSELMDTGLPMDMGMAEAGEGGGTGGGRGTGDGTGIGSGRGPGKGMGSGGLGIGALIPTIMKGRCTDSERLAMLRDAGGTPAVEEGVKKSLAWLKGKQNSDGSWGNAHKVAMTGLSLLCYLGHCENTQSKEYGDNVSRGITYLVNISMQNEGKMASNFSGNSWVYEHAIATYALSEALTFSRGLQFPVPNLEEAVLNGATLIVNGQTAAGSWDYHYKAESDRNDLSVAGWQMQALKAAKASGVKIKDLDKATRNAVKWLESEAYLDNGRFAYTGRNANPGLTAVGVLCLQQWDKSSSRAVRGGLSLIMEGLELRNKPGARVKDAEFSPLYTMRYNGPNGDLYAWYYAVQAMRNAGGKEWEAMNKAILEDILPAQNGDGSFKTENGQVARNDALVHVRGTEAAGTSRDIYLQCLNTLMLEVYYRFLPATSAGKGRSGGLDALDDLR
ncbi:terpene cyclase/mutase family protein [Luteolibacter flavescens]|uniref:Terpene cyclase/mutase family protein n=1 Tax=Luteolibacter flavescens TaxID=1859460 RepID=A0ABT3FNE6_9BACT|nr:prenyltransferase/squalene oxidase repeat-containing protein [Luteolibacter flavescens]MCW1885078.1 terpene cyclase/mutase family protein [Luteolibacter flavescens]